MDYRFENLGPERFQYFCQSLLTREFPDLQCFPIGQPDGGRDALMLFHRKLTTEFAVFQVKFVREPQKIDDIFSWLSSVLEGELPKISRLIPKGAKKYYLLTNLKGSAHLDVGTIDKINALVKQLIPIETFCWWRDDLSRRLDINFELKWAYPELLTGIDVFKHLLEQGISEERERRISTMKAFLRDQFKNDREVRFKQVELQNDLMDLFVDVPLNIRAITPNRNIREQGNFLINHIANLSRQKDSVPEEDGPQVGSAAFLLNHLTASNIPYIILEGAPGQGKSTITQYICQIHRKQLLEAFSLEQLNSITYYPSLRFPIRVDLRDLALWLSKN